MTAGNSSGCSFEFSSTFHTSYLTVSLSFFIIIENFIGMTVIWRNKKLHTNANILIFSLALADYDVALAYFMEGLVYLPQVTIERSVRMHIETFLMGSCVSMVTLSCVNMGCIAIERYIYISHPFYYQKYVTKGLVMKTGASLWAGGVIYEILPFFIYIGGQRQYHGNCILRDIPPEYAYTAGSVYLVVLIVIFFCYSKICRLAVTHKMAFNNRKVNTGVMGKDYLYQENRKAFMKSLKFFAIVFGIFFLCTFPPLVMCFYSRFHDVPDFLFGLNTILYLINSCMNFPIYAYMNRDFSTALRQTFASFKHFVFCRKSEL